MAINRFPDGKSWTELTYSTLGSTNNPQLDDINTELIPQLFVLYQNYPTPFNPSTIIRYDLPNNSFVSLTVYDMMGRVVKNLIKRTQVAGFQSVQWDATNNKNQPVSAGIYIYSIYSDSFVVLNSFVLVSTSTFLASSTISCINCAGSLLYAKLFCVNPKIKKIMMKNFFLMNFIIFMLFCG